VLAGLGKRIAPDVKVSHILDLAGAEEAAKLAAES
jgi:hypothetical protein